MSSGIKLTDECVTLIEEMKLKKVKNTAAIMKITPDGKYVGLEKTFPKNNEEDQECEWKQAMDLVLNAPEPERKCCFIVGDLKVPQQSGGIKDQMFCVYWAPEDSKIRDRMMNSTTAAAMMAKMPSGSKRLEASAPDEIEYSSVLDKMKK